MTTTGSFWIGPVQSEDDFGSPIIEEFVDGRCVLGGTWAIMSPESWKVWGSGLLGPGRGQRYRKQPDGRWLKVEG